MVGIYDIYKSSGVIDGFAGKKIDISEQKDWPKELIIQNCPNVEEIYVSDLISSSKLTKLTIKGCTNLQYLDASNNNINEVDLSQGINKLETVFLNNNKLAEFDASLLSSSLKKLSLTSNKIKTLNLSKCSSLQILNCGINKLDKLDLKDCNSLRSLFCYSNSSLGGKSGRGINKFKKLEVKHLTNLKELYCQGCCLRQLDVSGLTNLKELVCFGRYSVVTSKNVRGLIDLNIGGCKSLEILDLGEGCLENLQLVDYPNLHVVSVKKNSLKNLTVDNCPELGYLDFTGQGIYKKVGLKKSPVLVQSIPTKTIINNSPNLEKIYFSQEAKFFFSQDQTEIPKEEFWKQFPKLLFFNSNDEENPAFDEWLDKKREEERRRNNFDEGYESDDDTIDASNYKIPERKDIIVDHDLSHWNLTGELVIDGWANLKSLNVGNNELNRLIVKNCPNLKRLIYAHNKMPKEAIIENCPNLTEIDNKNYDGGIEWKGELSEAEKARINLLKLTEEYNDKIYLILQREEQGENIDLDELSQLLDEIIDKDLIKFEHRDKIIALWEKKHKARHPEYYKIKDENEPEEIKIKDENEPEEIKKAEALQKIGKLIVEAEKALKKKDFKKLRAILKEMKNYSNLFPYYENKELINKFEQELLKNNQEQLKSNSENTNIIPTVIGVSLTSVVLILLLIKVSQVKFKKMFKFTNYFK